MFRCTTLIALIQMVLVQLIIRINCFFQKCFCFVYWWKTEKGTGKVVKSIFCPFPCHFMQYPAPNCIRSANHHSSFCLWPPPDSLLVTPWFYTIIMSFEKMWFLLCRSENQDYLLESYTPLDYPIKAKCRPISKFPKQRCAFQSFSEVLGI